MDKDVHVETVPRKLTTYETIDAARRFAGLLRELEYVEKVILEEGGWEGLRLWVVLSSPAFEDRYADPVYEAQGRIIDDLSDPVFDFRVVNQNELKGRLDEVLPANANILYERHVHA